MNAKLKDKLDPGLNSKNERLIEKDKEIENISLDSVEELKFKVPVKKENIKPEKEISSASVSIKEIPIKENESEPVDVDKIETEDTNKEKAKDKPLSKIDLEQPTIDKIKTTITGRFKSNKKNKLKKVDADLKRKNIMRIINNPKEQVNTLSNTRKRKKSVVDINRFIHKFFKDSHVRSNNILDRSKIPNFKQMDKYPVKIGKNRLKTNRTIKGKIISNIPKFCADLVYVSNNQKLKN